MFYPRVVHLKGASTWVGPGLTHKHKTRLERLAKDKHLSLLQKSVNYGRKKFSTRPHVTILKKISMSLKLTVFVPGKS